MKKLFFTLCLTTVVWCGATAQMHLTLDQALDLALSENPTIRVAQIEIERFDYVKRQTWGAWIPQIAVTGTYTRSIVKQSMTKGLSFGADNTLAAQGDATWAFFAPTVFRTLRMNNTQREAAVEAARGSRIDLVAEVKTAFFNILLAEQSLAVLHQSEAMVQRTVDDTKVKFDNGLASEYDYLTAQVQLSNLRPTILQTENAIRLSKLMLKMYLSIPEQVEIEVSGELDAMRNAVLAGTDGLTTDAGENASLRALDFQEQLLRHQLKVSNASRWPAIAAFFTGTYTGNDIDMTKLGALGGGDGGGTVLDGSSFWWQNPMSAGLRVSIPLFSGLTRMNKSREIKNQLSQLALQRDYARQQVDVQVRQALNNLLTARETMYAQELTVEQAAKAYKISDTRYRAGAGTMLELNSAQLAQTQAQLAQTQAIFDYLTAKTEYDRIIGRER